MRPFRRRAANAASAATAALASSVVTVVPPSVDPPRKERGSKPLYPRLLRLRHIHPNAWQRAALGEGALVVAMLLVLADLASAWTLLVLPLAVAAVVKVHDVVAGALTEQRPGDPAGG